MKRVKAACICQTLHFQLKDGLEHSEAVQQVRVEVDRYKRGMVRNGTLFKIKEETVQPDGSLMVELKKQVNHYDCTPYFTRV